MNKKLFTAFLFGAAVLSTSTFVSCKDYSDEISDLQTQINNANNLHATKVELETVKADLQTQLETAKSELTNKIDELQKASDKADEGIYNSLLQEVERATAQEAVLEAEIDDLDDAIDKLTLVVDGKVDKTDFDKTVEEIYAKVAACSQECAKNLAEAVQTLSSKDDELAAAIEAAKKELKDADALLQQNIDKVDETAQANKTALEALKADYEQQKAVCEKYEGYVDNILKDYLTSADKTELENKITAAKEDLQEQINSLANRVTALEEDNKTNKADIATLKTEVAALQSTVVAIQEELDALNLLVKTSLRSLVFIPDAYYWGVEATEINYLEYQLYSNFPVPAEKDTKMDGKLSSVQVLAETEPADGEQGKLSGTLVRPYGSNYHNANAKYVEGTKILKFAAHYHLNPSSADLTDAKFALVTGDREYIHKSFDEADALLSVVSTTLDGENTKVADGKLTMRLQAEKPELIKAVPDNEAITIFAAQVTLPKEGNGAKADTTITSDYATLYRSTIKNLVIAHTDVRIRDNKHNEAGCGDCEYYKKNSGETAFAGNHLFATWKEATQQAEYGIYGNTAEGQDTCDFDKTLDLRTLVETHYTDESGTHMYMDADKLAEVGLKYKFELVGFYSGKNVTSESVHAAINPEDGYTFNPQIPTETHYTEDRVYIDGGHQRAYNESAELNDSSLIGRIPIVRVSLVDADDETKVYDYGYIPIRISYTKTVTPPAEPTSVTFKGGGWKQNYCEFPVGKMSTSWDMIEWSIYNDILHISKNVFDQHYAIVRSGDYLQQYEQQTDGTFKEYTGIGYCYENRDELDLQTHTVDWNVPSAWFKAQYEKDPSTRTLPDEIQTVVKYKSDSSAYPDVYIVLKMGGLTWSTFTATGLTDAMKIYEYWYKNQTMEHGTFDEVHVNTYEPENQQGHITCSRLENDVYSVFNGNIIALKGVSEDALTAIVFSTKPDVEGKLPTNNNGRKFQAEDGKVWVGEVSADGKTLYVKNGSDKEVLATIKTQADAGHYTTTFVEYATNDVAKSILNNCDSKNFADIDGVKEDPLVTLQINAWACKTVADWYKYALDDYTWDVRFLRPINVLAKENYYVDASTDQITGHQDHIINLRDLVELCDWRSKKDWATVEASRVWSQKCTDECNDGETSHPMDYAKDYWNYYQINQIAVDGATKGMTDQDVIETYTDNDSKSIEVSGVVYTDLNANLRSADNKIVKLSSVSDMVDLYYYPNVKSKPCYGTPASYGTLVYTNRGENINSDFHIYVPIVVKYYWGYVRAYDPTPDYKTQYVRITIKATMNDNTAKKRH